MSASETPIDDRVGSSSIGRVTGRLPVPINQDVDHVMKPAIKKDEQTTINLNVKLGRSDSPLMKQYK